MPCAFIHHFSRSLGQQNCRSNDDTTGHLSDIESHAYRRNGLPAFEREIPRQIAQTVAVGCVSVSWRSTAGILIDRFRPDSKVPFRDIFSYGKEHLSLDACHRVARHWRVSRQYLVCPKFIGPAPTIFEERDDSQWAVRLIVAEQGETTSSAFLGSFQQTIRSVNWRTARTGLHSRYSQVTSSGCSNAPRWILFLQLSEIIHHDEYRQALHVYGKSKLDRRELVLLSDVLF